jgi:hypothetical protein
VSIPMEALKTLTLSLPKIMLGVADRNIAPHLGSLTNQPVSALRARFGNFRSAPASRAD